METSVPYECDWGYFAVQAFILGGITIVIHAVPYGYLMRRIGKPVSLGVFLALLPACGMAGINLEILCTSIKPTIEILGIVLLIALFFQWIFWIVLFSPIIYAKNLSASYQSYPAGLLGILLSIWFISPLVAVLWLAVSRNRKYLLGVSKPHKVSILRTFVEAFAYLVIVAGVIYLFAN